MIRSIWKGKYLTLFNFRSENKLSKPNLFLLPEFINFCFICYTGKIWIKFNINELMLNLNLSCFVLTRKHGVLHNLKKLKKTLKLKKKKLTRKILTKLISKRRVKTSLLKKKRKKK